LPYIFILRLNTLLNPIDYQTHKAESILMDMLYKTIPNPLMQNIIANLLIFIQVLLINQIFIKNRISKEITLFAGLLYILFISIISENNLLSPILIANTFIILAVANLLNTYKLPNATVHIFNTGFFIGVASAIYTPYFTFILFGIIALLLLRSFRILEKLQFFIGLSLPYFFLFTYKYWFNIKFADLDFVKEIFFRLPTLSGDNLLVFYISVAFLFLCIGFAILNYPSFTSKKSIQSQKKIDIIYWFMFFTLISFFIFKTSGSLHLISLVLPLSLLMGIYLSDSKRIIFNELVHIFIVALIFITQFKLINF
jgi:Family of unknown function (DUF6427)